MGAVLLASCGKSSVPSAGTSAANTAYLRVVNGSADIETVNPSLPPTAPACNFGSAVGGVGTLISVQIDGVAAASSFPYETVSQYVAVPAAAANVSVVYPGGNTGGCPALTFVTPALKGGTYQTVVVAGAYVSKTLQFMMFSDPAPASSPGVQISNAAPQSGTTGVGSLVPGSAVFQSAGSVAPGQSAALPSAPAAPGLAYYAGTPPAAAVTLAPSKIYSFDTNDTVPFASYGHLSLYVVDPVPGGTMPNLTGAFY